jgi:heat-inducible transcriptional repressor
VPSHEDRRFDVLRAIVEDFVATQEPVGSKVIAERYALGVSPATVRNDMAVLEEQGLITQPHTSAGRIPTDRGYRAFVDSISQVKPLSPPERRAITTFLDGAVDLDDVVHRSVRLLAALTHQVAVVQWPSLTRSSVRHVELVSMAPSRVLVVLITDTGRVEQRSIELAGPVPEVDVAELRTRLSQALNGLPLNVTPAAVVTLQETVPRHLLGLLSPVAAALMEAAVERPDERIAVAGTAHLSRQTNDFASALGDVLEAIEEQVVLLKLLGEISSSLPEQGVAVRIGEETASSGLAMTSMVAAGYGSTATQVNPLGALGVVGPTRMDYPGTMGAVLAVARYVGQLMQTG